MLPQFLDFNKQCPLCNEPLRLYMRWSDSIFFTGKSIGIDTYQFDPYVSGDKNKTKPEQDQFRSESMLLSSEGRQVLTEFTSNGLFNEAKKHHLYFFYLCNPKGIKEKDWGDFAISLFKACYYRSTPFYEFKVNDDGRWDLGVVNPDHIELANKDESFAFNLLHNELEKVYMMKLDYELKDTTLWYYTVTEEQKKIENFRPNLFEKTLPMLGVRPNFSLSDRQRLIERFDNWILMS